MRSADLDDVAGLRDGSIALDVRVTIPDPHLPSLQVRNPTKQVPIARRDDCPDRRR